MVVRTADAEPVFVQEGVTAIILTVAGDSL